jgi:hypothetical protein
MVGMEQQEINPDTTLQGGHCAVPGHPALHVVLGRLGPPALHGKPVTPCRLSDEACLGEEVGQGPK